MRSRKFYTALRRSRRRWAQVCDGIFGPVRSFRVRLSISTWLRRDYESITLVHQTLSRNSEIFFDRVRDALDLIRSTDPRAWRMVEREIRYITNEYQIGGGAYVRWSRVCTINFDQGYINDDPDASDEETREWYVAAVAGTIVHEATHGRLDSLGIPYAKRTRSRIERICTRRMHQFLARLESENYELTALAPPFDEGDWAIYWNPARRRERQRELWTRVWPDIRATWTKK